MKRDARRLSRNFQSKWVQCRYIYICMYPALGFSIFHSRLGDSKSWKSSAIVSTLRAFNQASIFFLSLFLPFLLLVVVVDALPLRGFPSLSLFCPCPPTRNTASFFLTLFSVYRVSHVKCCVQAILLEIVAGIDALVFVWQYYY